MRSSQSDPLAGFLIPGQYEDMQILSDIKTLAD